MKIILFLLVIFFANIIQGITGFAGTVLAMPFGLYLVGFKLTKPVLNALGILAGAYVFCEHGKHINKDEFKKTILIMLIGIVVGFSVKSFFIDKELLLYKLLGSLIILLSISGAYSMKNSGEQKKKISSSWFTNCLLILAGVVHGMFVCGGPILIGYLSKKIKDKLQFRATISSIWIVLNTIILMDDIRLSLWNSETFKMFLLSVPVLFIGMYVGSRLCARMSQRLFMKATYILMFISGVLLFMK